MVLSDSHGRDLASILRQNSRFSMSTLSFVKPNAKLEQVIENVGVLARNLTKNDVIFVMGGTNNDLSNFNYDIITSFVEQMKHTNIILSSIPYRYDDTRLNNKIFSINSNIAKLANNKTFTFFNINEDRIRPDYTSGGLHFGFRIKQVIGTKIMKVICDVLGFSDIDLKHTTTNVLRLRGPDSSSNPENNKSQDFFRYEGRTKYQTTSSEYSVYRQQAATARSHS